MVELPITQADRELLAEAYKADGSKTRVESILNDEEGDLWYHDRQALRAIAKARQQARAQALLDAAKICISMKTGIPDMANKMLYDAYQKILALIDKSEGAV